MELTERQRAILKMVVESYVQTAAPIPSEKIAGQPGLKFSPATVRNELMEMEELGLLTHPHTSAGRVPSDLGYRYYIEHLMPEVRLSPVEAQTIWHQFHQVEAEIDEWVPLAAAIMAQMSRTAALVTRLRSREQKVKRIELVSVEDDLVLVVLIMQSGSLQQRMLRLDQPVERGELIKTANKLSTILAGKTGDQVIHEAAKLSGLEQEIATTAARMIEQSQRNWGGDIFYEGIGFVSVEPEFGRVDRVVELMEVLQHGSRLAPIFTEVLDSRELRVVIGSENRDEEMQRWSMILRRYGLSDQAAGVLGVVGPTRMKYWRTVSMVRFMGDLMDRLIEQSLQQRR